jgi:4'-phosphopantetheinyl transferase
MFEQPTVHVLYTQITNDLPEDINRMYLAYLPESLRVQYFKYRRWQDRAANLFSKILLIKGLRKFGMDHKALENLRYTEYGRPYLGGNVDFNISHSGQYIVCAVGHRIRLGIDIEEIKPVDFSEFEDLMTAAQWQIIKNAEDPLKSFFKYWSIKESIIKADGRGLSIPLQEIVIEETLAFYESTWYLRELGFNESYCTHIAMNTATPTINTEYIDVNQYIFE